MGRKLLLNKACVIKKNYINKTLNIVKAICWIDFNSFCNKELGSADYIGLATHCPIVILTGIPEFIGY